MTIRKTTTKLAENAINAISDESLNLRTLHVDLNNIIYINSDEFKALPNSVKNEWFSILTDPLAVVSKPEPTPEPEPRPEPEPIPEPEPRPDDGTMFGIRVPDFGKVRKPDSVDVITEDLDSIIQDGQASDSVIEIQGPQGRVSLEDTGRGLENLHVLGDRGNCSKVTIVAGDIVDNVHFWDARILNEKNAKSPVMMAGYPGYPGHWDGTDWTTKPNDEVGLVAFHNTHFGGLPDSYVWNIIEANNKGKEACCKMNLHPEGRMDMWLDGCSFETSQEHSYYSEWVRKILIENCAFGATGGNTIQVASRRGRLEVPGYSQGYNHGNPYHIPAGLNGWAVIRNNVIDDTEIWSRESTGISFFGFLGPIFIQNQVISGSRGGVAVVADTYKGQYLVGSTKDPSKSKHYVKDTDQELNPRDSICPALCIDELVIDGKGNEDREQIMISGVRDTNIGRFKIAGNRPHIVLDTKYGGPFETGKLTFWDYDSVQASLGKIGRYDDKLNKIVMFTEEQLQDMMYDNTVGIYEDKMP